MHASEPTSKVPKDVKGPSIPSFSLAQLSQLQNQSENNRQDWSLASKLKLSFTETEKAGSVPTPQRLVQHGTTSSAVVIPSKPPLFSLADLTYKGNSSSPPVASTRLASTPPRQHHPAANPPVRMSLAQLAQQQTSRSQDLTLKRDSSAGISLSALAEMQSFKDSRLSSVHSKSTPTFQDLASKDSEASTFSGSVFKTAKGGAIPKLTGPSFVPSDQRPGHSLSALARLQGEGSSGLQQMTFAADKVEKHPLPASASKPMPKIDLSALAAQHKIPTRSVRPAVATKASTPSLSDSALSSDVVMAKPSVFGKAICGQYPKVNCEAKSVLARRLKFPQFSFTKQTKDSAQYSPEEPPLVPFDFATPSPDDIVLRKQEAAFTRSGNRSRFQC